MTVQPQLSFPYSSQRQVLATSLCVVVVEAVVVVGGAAVVVMGFVFVVGGAAIVVMGLVLVEAGATVVAALVVEYAAGVVEVVVAGLAVAVEEYTGATVDVAPPPIVVLDPEASTLTAAGNVRPTALPTHAFQFEMPFWQFVEMALPVC
jgi:hypothetical protein